MRVNSCPFLKARLISFSVAPPQPLREGLYACVWPDCPVSLKGNGDGLECFTTRKDQQPVSVAFVLMLLGREGSSKSEIQGGSSQTKTAV
jgi:hypothetical protein